MGVTIDDAEIDHVHRVGKISGSSPCQMIIKFKGYRAKLAVLKSRRKLKGKKDFMLEKILLLLTLICSIMRRQCVGLSFHLCGQATGKYLLS